MLRIAGVVVQVGECCQRLKHGAGGIADLHLQRIKCRSGAGFRRIDVQPETERSRCRSRRYGDLLHHGVSGGGSPAVHPGVKRAGVRRFSG